MADLYTITDGVQEEKLELGAIIKRCEHLATLDNRRYFVGREAIRGRLRCGVRDWDGLTAPVKSASQRVKSHKWRGK